MLRRLTFLLLLLSGSLQAFTQPGYNYTNGWYNPGNVYVKLQVWEDGIYRVTKSDLDAINVDTDNINPANYHLIFRGEEQYIYVEENAGMLQYIEFYGKRNDGVVDSLMYRDPTNSGQHGPGLQPNKRQSMYSDTAAYFLTWDAQAGLRYSGLDQNNYWAFSPEPWFRYESYFEFPFNNYNSGGGGQYDPNHALNSDYVHGEGYLGSLFKYGLSHGRNIDTKYFANSGNPSYYYARDLRKIHPRTHH